MLSFPFSILSMKRGAGIMSTLKEVVDMVDDVKLNAYSDTAKTEWINRVEGWVKDKVIKTFSYFEISRLNSITAYTIPAGVTFPNIVMGYMDNCQIQKLDDRSYEKIGYFLGSDGKINIYPIPTADDTEAGLRFVYKVLHTKYVWSTDQSEVLLVPAPYDCIYEYYIYAMIDWMNKEYKAYENSMILYNSAWEDMCRWYKTNNPIPAIKVSN